MVRRPGTKRVAGREGPISSTSLPASRAAAERSAAGRAEGPGGGASTRSPDRAPAAASARSGRMPGTGPPHARQVTPRGTPCTGLLYGPPGVAAGPRGPRKTRFPRGRGSPTLGERVWAGCQCTGVRRSPGVGVFAGRFSPCVLLGGPAAAEEWSVKTVPRTDGPGTRCVLESTRQSLSDGYQDTTAYVTVDSRLGGGDVRRRISIGSLLGHRPRRRSGAPGADGPARLARRLHFSPRSTGDWSSSSRRGTAFGCSSGSGRSGRRPGRTRPRSV